jgi:hypothetical protein
VSVLKIESLVRFEPGLTICSRKTDNVLFLRFYGLTGGEGLSCFVQCPLDVNVRIFHKPERTY